jgi:hypothetical protein
MLKIIPALAASLLLSACGGGGGGNEAPTEPVPDVGQGKSFTAYLTGYSYWDNTPPGSATIARPIIHDKAGGTGTYDDPITLAVGHSKTTFTHTLDYPAGTRFYFSKIRKYAIVEDLCGDGPRPQEGACHIGKSGKPWLDIYVDGSESDKEESEHCMYRITGMQRVIIDPDPNRAVHPGPLTESGCRIFI